VRPARVTIVSRIFAPEVSAAAGLLGSWARAFRAAGCEVTVVTTTPPSGSRVDDEFSGIDVRRAPVLRDRQQYVRGYLSYLSFDIPLFFRLLFLRRRPSVYVVEPPPTTVGVVRLVAALRRVPYVVDAADLWSDAAAMVTASRLVLAPLRAVELWGLAGARHLLAAHDPLIARFRELGVRTPATAIGFGADTHAFAYEDQEPPASPVFVYAGTHSEWHGAGIFVEAFARILPSHPGATLRFIGNGQERDQLRARAQELDIEHSVFFEAPISPSELSPILASATASLASLKPGQGYDYAFTTKVYSSIAAGCPTIFAGVGPTTEFLQTHPQAGVALEYDVEAVAAALTSAAAHPSTVQDRRALSAWARQTFSLDAIADRVAAITLALVKNPPHTGAP
jgi:glycosyltransferase involved in cell wall biosynthesis